jgi:hypothetical protein
MQRYSDEKNQKGMKVIFTIAQLIVLGIVSMILYSAFIIVHDAIEALHISPAMYFPIVLSALIFPMLLHKYRQMFISGKMLEATIWMMAAASMTIVLLYVYVSILLGQ